MTPFDGKRTLCVARLSNWFCCFRHWVTRESRFSVECFSLCLFFLWQSLNKIQPNCFWLINSFNLSLGNPVTLAVLSHRSSSAWIWLLRRNSLALMKFSRIECRKVRRRRREKEGGIVCCLVVVALLLQCKMEFQSSAIHRWGGEIALPRRRSESMEYEIETKRNFWLGFRVEFFELRQCQLLYGSHARHQFT